MSRSDLPFGANFTPDSGSSDWRLALDEIGLHYHLRRISFSDADHLRVLVRAGHVPQALMLVRGCVSAQHVGG